jgi:hypothetical protein
MVAPVRREDGNRNMFITKGECGKAAYDGLGASAGFLAQLLLVGTT